MRRRTLKEYLLIHRWEHEREAAGEPRPWTEDCQTFQTLDDYVSGKAALDEAQLEHVRTCRYCKVRFMTLAEGYGLTQEKALAKLGCETNPVPPMAVQVSEQQAEAHPSPTQEPVSIGTSKEQGLHEPRGGLRSLLQPLHKGWRLLEHVVLIVCIGVILYPPAKRVYFAYAAKGLIEKHHRLHPDSAKSDRDALFLEYPDVNAPEIDEYMPHGWRRRGEQLQVTLHIYNCGKMTWKKNGHYLQWRLVRDTEDKNPKKDFIRVDRDIRPGEIWTARIRVKLPKDPWIGSWKLTARMSRMPNSENSEFGDYINADFVMKDRDSFSPSRD